MEEILHLTDEARDESHKPGKRALIDAVDSLAEAIERLAVRVERLERRDNARGLSGDIQIGGY